jgi:hypothetical protein
MMVLMALSTIASEQTMGMENTMEKAYQVLDYLATHPDATVRFQASDMVMKVFYRAKGLQQSLRPFFHRILTLWQETH